MKKILEAFKWFCTFIAIATVTIITVFGVKDHIASDTSSLCFGYALMFFTLVAGLYWAYYCLEKAFGKPKKKEAE